MRRLLGFLALVTGLALLAAGVGFAFLRRSLPPPSETLEVEGLTQPATLSYDAMGVPTIRAASEVDVAFAQGYAHARDRRFQMEIFRRTAAGRLGEMFGARAWPRDRRFRTLGFVHVADAGALRLSERRRALFRAYAEGVNAWDRAHAAPPELSVLGIDIEPWRPRDSLLVLLLMYSDLQGLDATEAMIDVMDASLPPELVAFLLPETTPLDLPLVPASGSGPRAPDLPGPDRVNVRSHPVLEEKLGLVADADANATGSNNWVIGPARTVTGGAILAGDPHLGLSVPVIWHRQRLEAPGLHVTGITLPGTPGVVIGGNGDVAWAVTNVEGDFQDLVRVEVADRDSTTYRGPEGVERFRLRREFLRAKGGEAETLLVRDTRWGPIVARSPRGGLLALQWTALDPSSCDMDLLEIDAARSVADFFERLEGFLGPAQNFVAADRAGHIGWRIGGRFPKRVGFDSRRPRDGRNPASGWRGYLTPDSAPYVLDPAAGFLATANQRTLGGEPLARIGRGGYAMPWRVRRIHGMLAARKDWNAALVHGLQNDVDDAFLVPTAQALTRALTPEACRGDSTLTAARRVVGSWTHRADTTSAAHAYLRTARRFLTDFLVAPLVAPCRAVDSTFVYRWPLSDEVARRLLEARPMHLLDPAYRDFDELVRAVARRAAQDLTTTVPGMPLDSIVWGRINVSRIHHPLGDAMPALGRVLDMPDVALAGGSSTVRVANPRSGASMRMVIDLADPRRSLFALPGGQSGHFLSPHYGDGFAAWVSGRGVPFEPGPARHTIRLNPSRRPRPRA